MATDLNVVIVIGRLVRDPEMRYTAGGTPVCSFSIANNKTWTKDNEKKEQVSFFNCVAWGKSGELITQYMTKGSQIQITGRLEQRTWQTQDGQNRSTVEINVDGFQFLGSKGDGSQSAKQVEPNVSIENNPFEESSIPF